MSLSSFWRRFQFDVGTTVTISFSCVSNNQFTDVATARIIVKTPGGVESTPEVVRDSQGNYHTDVVAGHAGKWYYRVETIAPSSSREGSFFVRQSNVLPR